MFKTIDNEPEHEVVDMLIGKWDRIHTRFTPTINSYLLPVNYDLCTGVRIDFLESQLFHYEKSEGGDVCLCLYDAPGAEARISINNIESRVRFPEESQEPVPSGTVMAFC